jgi:hypothetical protein
MAGAKELWKVRAPPKLKFFVWLVLQDRCWTAQHRKRHKLQDHEFALCSQELESIYHLLLGFCYSREVWWCLLL